MVDRRSAIARGRAARAALLFLLFAAAPTAAFPLELTISGGFGAVIDQSSLAGGAGSNLAAEHQSAADAVIITVAGTIDASDAWQLQARVDDPLWHGSLGLKVLRTGPGTGTGSVTGGDVLPLELTGTDQVFFQGSGDRASIPIRLVLTGVSVLVPADTYTATLVCTVVDIP